MTNYEIDTLNLIPGETPAQKYANTQRVYRLLEKIAFPRRGSDEEKWDIGTVADMIIENKLIPRP